jgi:hypothetical protein
MVGQEAMIIIRTLILNNSRITIMDIHNNRITTIVTIMAMINSFSKICTVMITTIKFNRITKVQI